MITVSLLRRTDIIDDNGDIIDHPELSEKQTIAVINGIISACNGKSPCLRTNIDDYIARTSIIGRSIPNSFPEFIIIEILRNYGSKLIDYLLLEDD